MQRRELGLSDGKGHWRVTTGTRESHQGEPLAGKLDILQGLGIHIHCWRVKYSPRFTHGHLHGHHFNIDRIAVAIDCGGDGAFAKAVLDALVARGIFVRMPFAAPQNRCIRISCSTTEELDYFAAALPDALAEAGGT